MNESQFEKAEELTRLAQREGIEAAKKALQPNNIEYCIDCGIKIPEARKAAMPSACRCIDCESLRG